MAISGLSVKLQEVWARPRQRTLWCVTLLALLSLLQYAYSVGNEFVWDAKETFLLDPSIRDISYLPGYFTESAASHMGLEGEKFAHLNYYRPAIKLLHLGEFQLFGEQPLGYNAVNILLNMAVVVVGFFLVQALSGKPLLALLAGLVYAVNPSRVEAVSWSYSDSYLVFALFCLLALLAFHYRRYVWSLAAFVLALFSQESAVLLPLVLGLYVWLIRGARGPRDFMPLLPFVVATVGFLLLRSAAVGAAPLTDLGPLALANAAATILLSSVQAFFVPQAGISIYHYRAGMFGHFSLHTALAYGVTLALAGVAWWLWRSRRRAELFWFLWFFVWMAVIFNVGKYAEYYFMDKILFLGALGFSVLLAQLALEGPWRGRVGAGAITLLIVAHFGVSLWRTGFYHDEQAYFEEAAKAAPDFALVQYALASHYREQGAYRKALEHFQQTVAIDPRHSYAQNNIGNIYFLFEDYPRAISAWQAAIAADPANPQPYYNVGIAMERQGDAVQALEYYRKYLAMEAHPAPQIVAYVQRLERSLAGRP